MSTPSSRRDGGGGDFNSQRDERPDIWRPHNGSGFKVATDWATTDERSFPTCTQGQGSVIDRVLLNRLAGEPMQGYRVDKGLGLPTHKPVEIVRRH